MKAAFLSLIFLVFTASVIHAAQNDTSRASNLYRQLRCLTCQSQSVADSNAPLAQDIRALVDQELESGKSDEEILSQLAARYGDAILMTPPLNRDTAALWYGPLAFLLLGACLAFTHFRKMRREVK